jgi:Terminase RNaseH-like domain
VSKYCVQASWDDAPHLSSAQKESLYTSIPPYQRDARSKGIPQLGSGAIYPVPESEIICDPFRMPNYWPRGYGLDVGWNRTAAIWGAWDRENDVIYLYSEYYRGQAEPSVHAAAIKARGDWIMGAIDPASRGRSQVDGEALIEAYEDLGLNLVPAVNAVEAGLNMMWERLSTQRLVVFSTLHNFLTEYRLYRRDEKGRIVKQNDHAMDAARYLIATSDRVILPNLARAKAEYDMEVGDHTRSDSTGY